MLTRPALRSFALPLLILLVSAAAEPDAPTESTTDAATDNPIVSHETLDYQIEWRLVTAGHAKLDWYSSPVIKDGWETKLHLESTGLISRLFHVNDDYTSQMNGNMCATSTFMTAREGNRLRDTKITFDSAGKKADYFEKDLKTNEVIRKEVSIPPCVHDIIGGLYVLRTMNLEPGKTGQIPITNGKKMAYLKVESQRREEIRLPSGSRKVIRYEIFAFDNQLYTRPGHLHVWLSDDRERIPLQIEIRLQFTIGTITLKLAKETRS